MELYSLNGAEPAPLPGGPRARIRVPDGAGGWRTRTGASSWTAGEIAAAGYAAAAVRPAPVGGIAAQWDGETWRSATAYDPDSQLPPVWDGVAWGEPQARPLADRQAAMRAAATARMRTVVADGASVGGLVVDLSAEGFERLSQAFAALDAGAGPIAAVTVRGEPIDLPDAATAGAVIAACRAHYLACSAVERALYDAIAAAADHGALDLIDVEAGTVDGGGGWP